MARRHIVPNATNPFAAADLLSTHRLDRAQRPFISTGRTLIVSIFIYLIVAAVVVCGCLFVMKARSRD
jgi:hypothetical protein